MSKEKKKKSAAALDEKSIAAITAEVEARVRQSPAAVEPVVNKPSGGSKGIFFWGAASGLALAVARPLLGRHARPVVRGAIKGGIQAGRYVRKTASGFKEDMQDLAAEAKADLDIEQKNPPHPPAA